METITIEVKYNCIKTFNVKLPRARRVWAAPGIEFYVRGPLNGHLYEQAANIAMHMCIERHIPAISLRRVR